MIQVSAIIPTYNRPEELARALLALNVQRTDSTYEVIVVDDGSSYDTRALVEKLSLTFQCRWYWQRHVGFRAARARNTGILFAEGDLIVFLDDDMVVQPELIEAHVNFHDRYNETVAIGLRRRVPRSHWSALPQLEVDSLAGRALADPRLAAFDSDEWNEVPWAYLNTCHASVRKRALLDAGLFDESFVGWGFEDTELAYRLQMIGLKFRPLREPVPFHLEPNDDTIDRGASSRSLLPPEKQVSFRENADHFAGKYPDDRLVRRLVTREHALQMLATRGVDIDGALPRGESSNSHNSERNAAEEIPACFSLLKPYEESDEAAGRAASAPAQRQLSGGLGRSLLWELQRSLGITVLRQPLRNRTTMPNWAWAVILTPLVGLGCLAMVGAMVITGRYHRIFRRG